MNDQTQLPRYTFAGRGYRRPTVLLTGNGDEVIFRFEDAEQDGLWGELVLNAAALRHALTLIESQYAENDD